MCDGGGGVIYDKREKKKREKYKIKMKSEG
jgi:hypothetical protein